MRITLLQFIKLVLFLSINYCLMSVLLITSLGDIVIDLYCKECPKASMNFIKLCKIKYYNNCLFYNVQKDYIAQSGDPENKGNEGLSIYGVVNGIKEKYFNDEISPQLKHNAKGLIATANKGPHMNSSPFYIQLTDKPLSSLNFRHTIFGKVEEGLDVVEKINNAYVDKEYRPYQNIRIKHTIVLDDPFEDIEGMIVPSKSPEPVHDNDHTRLEDDFNLNDFYKDQETEEKLKEKLQEQDAKNKAIILELLEDIPDSEIKPPDNVLFICKLNPITQDDDLETLFSRFGAIKSCQIVRDKKTGQSLQYGFIEFEKVEDCENAYLKMNGVVIDDKRIKVDFSQSVSKYWFNYKKTNRDNNITAKDSNSKEEQLFILPNDNVKLEIKRNKNFNADNKDYNYVFHEEKNKVKTRSRSRSNSNKYKSKQKEYYSNDKQHHHHHHHKHYSPRSNHHRSKK